MKSADSNHILNKKGEIRALISKKILRKKLTISSQQFKPKSNLKARSNIQHIMPWRIKWWRDINLGISNVALFVHDHKAQKNCLNLGKKNSTGQKRTSDLKNALSTDVTTITPPLLWDVSNDEGFMSLYDSQKRHEGSESEIKSEELWFSMTNTEWTVTAKPEKPKAEAGGYVILCDEAGAKKSK